MRRLEWSIAWRYLRSRRGSKLLSLISVIAIGGITVGVSALVVIIAVMNGLQNDLREKILVASPDVRVLTFGDDMRMDDWQKTLEKVKQQQGVVAAAPFVLAQAVVNANGHTYTEAVQVAGIEPEGPGVVDVTSIRQHALRGNNFKFITATGETRGAVLGKLLAERLNAFPGDRVTLYTAPGAQLNPVTGMPVPKVTVLEVLPKMLPGCDTDVVEVVARSFRKRGIEVRLGVAVTGHAPTDDGRRTVVHFGAGESITVDMVVVSVGRRPRSEGLLAEGTGVTVTERGHVSVDPYMRTSAPDVYAIGDLVPTAALAHVGYAEAIVAVKTLLGEPVVPVAYDRVPWCIYCHPEVSFAGMSEEQARAAGHDVVVVKERFLANSRAQIMGETEGLVKVIALKDPKTGRAGQILGVHMVGPWATEQLGQAYLAVNWEASVDEVAQFLQPHPSLSETFGEAMLALTGRGLNS